MPGRSALGSPLVILAARVADAATTAFGPDVRLPDPVVLPARDPRHGDLATPAAMTAARQLGRPPLELAQALADALDVADLCEPPTVAPPGFVNLRLRDDWLAHRAAHAALDSRAGVERVGNPRRVVVDMGGPNMAKEMHVGHLRSTIIGDALARVLAFLGDDVTRVNHVGDFGTQFGMLVAHLEESHPDGRGHGDGLDLGDLVAFYREAKVRFDTDPAFVERSRQRVVDLQAGEPTAVAAWSALLTRSREENDEVFALLGVEELVERGESAYAGYLAAVITDLQAAGLATEDDGALCVFPDGFTNKEGEPLPLIIRKRDGGYNYATTDLAALRVRVAEGARRILYVVDVAQSQHLEMVFATARLAGWVPSDVEVVHIGFGMVLGEDGKRLRTRSGETPRLRDLLDEAIERSRAFVVDRATERDEPVPDDLDRIARVVGLGAVKYADLSQNRTSNYVFSYDRMLNLKGDTAPYLQYAFARIGSILREAGWDDSKATRDALVLLDTPQERALALRLAGFGDVLDRVVEDWAPSHLSTHLYELSQAYNGFYEHCPVLRADEPVRTSRLLLCAATARQLRIGLDLLGIEVLERL